ncbi:MAG: hypothetical protein AAFR27_09530, partial [Pseudomonadota bacterium]
QPSPASFPGYIRDLSLYFTSISQAQANFLSLSVPVETQIQSGRKRFFLVVVGVLAVASLVTGATLTGIAISQENHKRPVISSPRNRTLQSVVDEIVRKVGWPATQDKKKFVGRLDLAVGKNYPIHLDLGGEGYHEAHGLISGFEDAINLNTQTTDSQDSSRHIPYLVYLPGGASWTPPPSYPFKDEFATYITMQGAPLTDKNVSEIARLIQPGRAVDLWIDQEDHSKQINDLARLMDAEINRDQRNDSFNGQAGFEVLRLTQGSKRDPFYDPIGFFPPFA